MQFFSPFGKKYAYFPPNWQITIIIQIYKIAKILISILIYTPAPGSGC